MIFGNTFGDYFSSNWKQFLDDCFVPWTKSINDLEILHTILNDLHTKIFLSYSSLIIKNKLSDVLVKTREGKIETDIYYKETDSTQYLLFYSCHPRHTKINIPYNLARRLRTIISEEKVLEKLMRELMFFFFF